MFRNEINVTMRPSVKEVKSFIVFHNHVNVMIYSALSSADDPLMIIQLMIERGRSTGGAGTENPPGGSNTYRSI